MLTPLRIQIRRRIAKMLRADYTPEQCRNVLRDCGVERHDVARMVLEEQKKLIAEQQGTRRHDPPPVDVTGLVPLWADGHYADPRSAEILFAARESK